jgi:hypothetical protein
MLSLRREQVEAFEQHLFDAMLSRIERAIAATFPELSVADGTREGEPSAEIESIVVRGVETAAEFGIHARPDIAAFIALGLASRSAGSSKPLPDWIKGWLNRPETAGSTKMAVIEAQLAEFGSSDPALATVARKVAAVRTLA